MAPNSSEREVVYIATLLYDVRLEFKTPLSLKVTWLVTPLDLIQSLT